MTKGTWGLFVGLIALSVLTLLVAPTMLNARYFPADFPKTGLGACGERLLEASEDVQRYAPQWRAAGEAPLYQVSEKLGGRTVYRFSWFPSFGLASVTVRLEEEPSGDVTMHAQRTRRISSGFHTRSEHSSRRLSPSEKARVSAVIGKARLEDLQPGGCLNGVDGAHWIVEKAEGGRYTYVNRHSPSAGPIWEIGKVFSDLSGYPMAMR